MSHDLRLLPRLMLDTATCVQLAYSDLDDKLKVETRNSIASLLQTDVTDLETAVTILKTVAQQMRQVEEQLGAARRPFAMRKVRSVRQRVDCDADLTELGEPSSDLLKTLLRVAFHPQNAAASPWFVKHPLANV